MATDTANLGHREVSLYEILYHAEGLLSRIFLKGAYIMKKIESLLSTLEIAEMLEMEHWQLLRKLNGRTGTNGKHIKGYVEILGDNQMVVTDFFRESTYRTEQNKEMPCYQVTRKGCEFLANKFVGEKGVLFTARYINRFHEMQDILSNGQQESELPWFIRRFRGEYIILWRDFSTITGVDIENHKPKTWFENITGGMDFNGCGWKCDNEKFQREYGFDYGDDPCMMYFYLCGIPKVLRLLENDKKARMIPGSGKVLLDGIKSVSKEKKEIRCQKQKVIAEREIQTEPIQISIVLNGSELLMNRKG